MRSQEMYLFFIYLFIKNYLFILQYIFMLFRFIWYWFDCFKNEKLSLTFHAVGGGNATFRMQTVLKPLKKKVDADFNLFNGLKSF